MITPAAPPAAAPMIAPVAVEPATAPITAPTAPPPTAPSTPPCSFLLLKVHAVDNSVAASTTVAAIRLLYIRNLLGCHRRWAGGVPQVRPKSRNYDEIMHSCARRSAARPCQWDRHASAP